MRSPRTTTKSSPCSPQLEKAHTEQRRPNTAKTNKENPKKQETKQKNKRTNKGKHSVKRQREYERKIKKQEGLTQRFPEPFDRGSGKREQRECKRGDK